MKIFEKTTPAYLIGDAFFNSLPVSAQSQKRGILDFTSPRSLGKVVTCHP